MHIQYLVEISVLCVQSSKFQAYLRCSTPSGVGPTLSSSQPAPATHHRTASREQLDDDTGMVRQEANSDASEPSPNNPGPTHHPCGRQM